MKKLAIFDNEGYAHTLYDLEIERGYITFLWDQGEDADCLVTKSCLYQNEYFEWLGLYPSDKYIDGYRNESGIAQTPEEFLNDTEQILGFVIGTNQVVFPYNLKRKKEFDQAQQIELNTKNNLIETYELRIKQLEKSIKEWRGLSLDWEAQTKELKEMCQQAIDQFNDMHGMYDKQRKRADDAEDRLDERRRVDQVYAMVTKGTALEDI